MSPSLRARPRRAASCARAITFAVLFPVVGLSAAFAHSWYEADCCSDQDCAAIDGRFVDVTEFGYVLKLPPNSHPMLNGTTKVLQFIVPHPTLRPSRDDRYHVCLAPKMRVVPEGWLDRSTPDERAGKLDVICFYAPNRAS